MIDQSRRPNTSCQVCGKPLYRKPNELVRYKAYCSNKCQTAVSRAKILSKKCVYCGNSFTHPDYLNKRKYCSHSCSNKARRGVSYTGNKLLHNQARLLIELSKKSGCDHCMVEGCNYSKTLDVHRLTQGKFGGQYEFDNIYAICPNHHAEFHRGVVTLITTGPFRLQAVETRVTSQLSKYLAPSKKEGRTLKSAELKEKKRLDREQHKSKRTSIQTHCVRCGKEFTITPYKARVRTHPYCSSECVAKGQEKISWPSTSDLIRLIWESPVSNLAKHLKVSDVAIKKHCKRLGISTPPRGYWAQQKSSNGSRGRVAPA